jgi:hypothetical protein
MKLTHKNIELIENWLDVNNLTIEFTDDFARRVYDEVLEDLFKLKFKESERSRRRAYALQYDFVRRDLLKIAHKRNNKSATGISAGYVYAIGNNAWPEYVKIGSAIDVMDRLNSYQTSSPLRDYFLIDYYFVYDRVLEENTIHEMFYDRNAEWCKISQEVIKFTFKEMKKKRAVIVLPEKISAVKNEIERTRVIEEYERLEKKRLKKESRRRFFNRSKV